MLHFVFVILKDVWRKGESIVLINVGGIKDQIFVYLLVQSIIYFLCSFYYGAVKFLLHGGKIKTYETLLQVFGFTHSFLLRNKVFCIEADFMLEDYEKLRDTVRECGLVTCSRQGEEKQYNTSTSLKKIYYRSSVWAVNSRSNWRQKWAVIMY